MPLNGAPPVIFVITRDRSAAEAFYGGVLGLPRLPGDDFAAVYDLAGVPLRLTEVTDHVPSPHPVLGWRVADIERTVRALAERGVRFNVYDGMGQDALGI
jgi:catechol 2,3-dioxygenase-like lactoylglutathione lyase family enzyme